MKTQIALLSLGLTMTTWVPGEAARLSDGFNVDKRLAEIAYYGGDYAKERGTVRDTVMKNMLRDASLEQLPPDLLYSWQNSDQRSSGRRCEVKAKTPKGTLSLLYAFHLKTCRNADHERALSNKLYEQQRMLALRREDILDKFCSKSGGNSCVTEVEVTGALHEAEQRNRVAQNKVIESLRQRRVLEIMLLREGWASEVPVNGRVGLGRVLPTIAEHVDYDRENCWTTVSAPYTSAPIDDW